MDHPLKLEWIRGMQGVEVPQDHSIVITISYAIEDVTERDLSVTLYTPRVISEPRF